MQTVGLTRSGPLPRSQSILSTGCLKDPLEVSFTRPAPDPPNGTLVLAGPLCPEVSSFPSLLISASSSRSHPEAADVSQNDESRAYTVSSLPSAL